MGLLVLHGRSDSAAELTAKFWAEQSWREAELLVVPAKAGTHNHRCRLSRTPAAHREAAADGSRPARNLSSGPPEARPAYLARMPLHPDRHHGNQVESEPPPAATAPS